MSEPQGWICPRCQLVLAPHVNEHRCQPPGPPAPVPAPIGGGGGGSGGLATTGGTSWTVT